MFESTYSSPDVGKEKINELAMKTLLVLDGLTVGQARNVLHQADIFLGSTHFVDVSGVEFQKAFEQLSHDAAE